MSGVASTARAGSWREALVFPAACSAGVVAGWNISNVGAIAQPIADDYGIALATVGLFTTALFAAHAAIQIPGGRAVDRLGAWRLAVIGVSVVAATNALALVAPELWLVLLARALMGLGTGVSFVAGSDYIRARGGGALAQGFFGGIGLAGGGIALAVVPQLEDTFHWRTPFLTALVVDVVALCLLALAPPDAPRRRRAVAQASAAPRPHVHLYRLVVLHIATFGLSVLASNWVVTLLTRHGESKGTAGLVGALTLIGGVVSRPVGGITATKPWVRTSLAVAVLCGAAGALLLILARPIPVAVLGSLLLGVAAGIPFAAMFTAAARARPEAPARAIGLVNGSGATVILIGTPLIGLTFSLPGDGRIGFAIIAALWAAAPLALPTRHELGID